MAKKDEDQVTPITKDQRNEVLQIVLDEVNRRQMEMHSDIYGNRQFSDGVREEVARMEKWLINEMK